MVGGSVGQWGKTLWLSYLSKHGNEVNTMFAVVSLFHKGHRYPIDEVFGVGRLMPDVLAKGQELGLAYRRQGHAKLGTNILLDGDLNTLGLQAKVVDTKVHRWVMKLEFHEDGDRILVFLDPTAEQLRDETPNAVLEGVDLSFTSIALKGGNVDEQFAMDELKIGLTYESVTSNGDVDLDSKP